MSYEIKGYDESYLKDQFLIGNAKLSNWPGTNMTTAEDLKQLYAQDYQTLDTKFYAFKDGKMVGFITSTVKKLKEGESDLRANLEFPLVLKGYEDAEDVLYDHAIKVLKEKGVKRVQSRASEVWGDTMEKVKKYSYEKKRVLTNMSDIEVVEFKNIEPELEIRNYTEKDIDAIRKFYIDNNILTQERLDIQLKYLEENKDQVVCWNLYTENGVVLGNSIVTYFDAEKDTAVFANISAFGENEEKIRRSILHKNISDCKEKGIKKVTLFLTGPSLEYRNKYEKLGLVFNPELSLYHKEI